MGRNIRIGRGMLRSPNSEVRTRAAGAGTRSREFVLTKESELRTSGSESRIWTRCSRRSDFRRGTCSSGFTLIELMVVIVIILILASFAMPSYHIAVIHAREAVLRDDLFTMRKLIDEYTIDKQQPPSSLDDLVTAGYLRGGIPIDPFTGSNETWKTDPGDMPISTDQSTAGIVDVHSGSDETSLDGTAYSSW